MRKITIIILFTLISPQIAYSYPSGPRSTHTASLSPNETDNKDLNDAEIASEKVIQNDIAKNHLKEKAEAIPYLLNTLLDSYLDNFTTINLYGLIFFIYFLPSVSAAFRQHPDTHIILFANLLLGWFPITWALTLIYASKRHNQYNGQ